jgi:processive 1,2-diacylglycerol beta-glucosyltransferase
MRKRGKIQTAQVTVTTDFQAHRLWVNEPCERYFTATDESAEYLAQLGVKRSRIRVTGIPVHPAFTRSMREVYSGRPRILQLAGGFGVGPIETIFNSLLSMPIPCDIKVVAGKNEKIRHKLLSQKIPSRHRVEIIGFTAEMPSMMANSDVVVTKPGGLTTSEALASGLPLLIVNPVPGQETLNSDFLLENGAAIKVHRPSMIRFKLETLIKNKKKLALLQKNALRLGRPNAAQKIIEESLREIVPIGIGC